MVNSNLHWRVIQESSVFIFRMHFFPIFQIWFRETLKLIFIPGAQLDRLSRGFFDYNKQTHYQRKPKCRMMTVFIQNRPGFDPWLGKIPWRREKLPTPVFWPGESHGLYSPWSRKELDMTERLSLHKLSLLTAFTCSEE